MALRVHPQGHTKSPMCTIFLLADYFAVAPLYDR